VQTDPPETNPSKLHKLASWYRDFAERAGDPMIWAARLRTANQLEAEADHVERTKPSRNRGHLGEAPRFLRSTESNHTERDRESCN
jgi:hypothetical protein